MPRPRKRLWRALRLTLRGCRIALLLLILLLLGAFLYFNRVGLPAFLKAPLLAELQRRGANLQFERLSWRWYHGFVAESVVVRSVSRTPVPHLELAEISLDVKWGRLLRTHQLELESLRFRGGRLILPLEEPGQPPQACSLDEASAELRFRSENVWELVDLRAAFMGATLHANGTVTNALAWARRPAGLTSTNLAGGPGVWRAPLRQVVETCKRMRFTAPPEFRLRFQGDARDPRSFTCELRCQAAGADTPWTRLKEFRLTTSLRPAPAGDDHLNVNLQISVADAQTPWGDFQQADFTAATAHPLTNALPARVKWALVAHAARGRFASFHTARLSGDSVNLAGDPARWRTELTLAANGLTSEWGSARSNHLAATFVHSRTNLAAAELDLKAELEAVQTRWAKAARLHLEVHATPETNTVATHTPAWPWLAKLPVGTATWQLAATNLQARIETSDLTLDTFRCAGSWAAPRLVLTNVHARLYGGTLELPELALDTATRQINARLHSDFEAHAVAPLLGAGAAHWLEQFRWARPPRVSATVRAELPAVEQSGPERLQALLPSIVLDARIEGVDAAYRDVPVQQASLSVGLSNRVLHLRDFHVVRPEGDADLTYDLHTLTQEFRWRVRGNLDPKAVGPAIDQEAPRLLSLFEFNGPAQVAGEVWGRWGTNKQLSLALGGVVTNFLFRGEPIAELRAGVRLSDHFLTATNASVRTDDGWIKAAAVGVDLRALWVYITNADAEIAPQRFARAIGSNLVNTLGPYRFDQPPRVHAEGRVPAQGRVDEADMQFTIAGGPFRFWRFNVPELETAVHWQGNHIAITNTTCSFYQGRLTGSMQVDLQPDGSANLAFRTAVTNVNLPTLVADTIPTTNRIEGVLHGTLDITHANSADWNSWNGSGRLQMRDGLLWNLPVFSILSPVLNTFVPGLGNNRASAATGSFTIENSVMRTDDLSIVANPAHLSYRGTLDFDWNVRARVEAEILPGAPLVGPLLNILFAPLTKALVFRIGGTLGKPELEPLYVPKFLMPLLRPFHTIKSVLPGGSATESAPNPSPDRKP